MSNLRSDVPLLEVNNLETHFLTRAGTIKAVNNVTFDIEAGEVLGIVGESGCGKSVTALSLMRLIPDPPGRIIGGEIKFNGVDLLRQSDQDMRSIRGRRMSMIFQEPMTSLNPVLNIGRQLTEVLELHLKLTHNAAMTRAAELLEMVGMSDPATRLRSYAHQFSGGMRQRVMIAMAVSCNPQLLIADEATTALDVTIQAQILELIHGLTSELGMSLIIISHNLGVIARYADRVNVMYAGRITESASAEEIFRNPRHPYTVGLLKTVPQIDGPISEFLSPIPGEIPDLANLPAGCSFHARCKWKTLKCESSIPSAVELSAKHEVACWEHERVQIGQEPTVQ